MSGQSVLIPVIATETQLFAFCFFLQLFSLGQVPTHLYGSVFRGYLILSTQHNLSMFVLKLSSGRRRKIREEDLVEEGYPKDLNSDC